MAHQNAQGYSGGIVPMPKHYIDKIITECNESSVLARVGKSTLVSADDLFSSEKVTYPRLNWHEEDTARNEGLYQKNARSEEVTVDFDRMEFSMCGRWKGHWKLDQEDWLRMSSEGNRKLFETSFNQYLQDSLDRRRDYAGLLKIAMSAHRDNMGTNAAGGTVNLGNDAAALQPTDGAEVNKIINKMITANRSHEYRPCKNGEYVVLVSPVMAGALREFQGTTLNLDNANQNTLVTGEFRNAYGVPIVETTRLPYRIVGGTKVYRMLLVDTMTVGAPLKNLYINRQQDGHDYGVFFNFVYDAHVIHPKGVVVASVDETALMN